MVLFAAWVLAQSVSQGVNANRDVWDLKLSEIVHIMPITDSTKTTFETMKIGFN